VLRLAEEPPKVVERVTESENHASTQFSTRSVGGPIVLPGMPIGQVLAQVGVDGNGPPDTPAPNQPLDLAQAGVKAELETNEHLHTGFEDSRA